MNFNVFHCSPTSKRLPCFKGRAVLVVRPLCFILCIRQLYVHPVLFATQFLVIFLVLLFPCHPNLPMVFPYLLLLLWSSDLQKKMKMARKWPFYCNVIALSSPCHGHIIAMPKPCHCIHCLVIAMSLPCQSHAIAMVPNGILIFLLPSITCCWKLKIPSMCCKSGATTKEPKVMAAPKMVDTFTIRLSEASWRFSGTCMSYGSCICKMYWYYMIYHIDN